jgi:hypothetical protein
MLPHASGAAIRVAKTDAVGNDDSRQYRRGAQWCAAACKRDCIGCCGMQARFSQ